MIRACYNRKESFVWFFKHKMEAYLERSTIIFYMKTDDFIAQSLTNVSNKPDIRVIGIYYSVLGSLNGHFFHGFNHLVNLELANCFLYQLDDSLFSNLVHLESINLSNNLINSIVETLFIHNLNLKTINLQNNLLESINSQAFSVVTVLETLDLSYNKISQISATFLISVYLKTLCLNNNSIATVNDMAFNGLPNLTHLALETNKIRNLNVCVLENLHQLQYLNLNNNLIYEILESLFWNCHVIERIYLADNFLTQSLGYIFFYNSALIDLDLSGNLTYYIESNVFKKCEHLKYLKLKVSHFFDINSIRPLKHLIQFELFYLSGPYFRLSNSFWSRFINKQELKILKLVFKNIESISLEQNFQITKLEDLHIECLQPSDRVHDINLSMSFINVIGLKCLVLKNLNAFRVVKYSNKLSTLIKLNLSGVQNEVFHEVFDGLTLLTHLDLSYSAIEFISLATFKDLVNLEYLDFQYSKLVYIKCFVFVNNTNLKFLSFYNCRISLIENYSFANLCNLETLDLRNNLLRDVSELVFFGLPHKTDIRI